MVLRSHSLQEKQKDNLLRMLDFNAESGNITSHNDNAADRWGEQWKILIYDTFCRDIISPILKLHELRKKGVTLHLLIDAERDAIPDVPAIYFIAPTESNIRRIVLDCTKQLYSAVYLNFAYPMTRQSLELLAKLSVDAGCTSMIAKVFDQYTNFVSLEPSLFSLNLTNSYAAYNDPNLPDASIEMTILNIVQGLLSVLVTNGSVPIIRCPNTDNPARMVAEGLNRTIQDHLAARDGVFNEINSNFQRPVLILLDRNEDLASMLHHPSTYQAVVDDLLSLQMNRVKVMAKTSGQDQQQRQQSSNLVEKVYDLDVVNDKFFAKHAGSLFPDAIDANEAEMKAVTKKEEEIRARTGGNDAIFNGTKDLAAAVDTLPMLVEKKKMLEIHTNIFHATFEEVTARHIPSYSMVEQKLIDGGNVDIKMEILPLLSSPEMGSACDKTRLLMIYYLTASASTSDLSSSVAEIENIYMQFINNPDNKVSEQEQKTLAMAWKFMKQHAKMQRQHKQANPSNAQSVNANLEDGGDLNANMSKIKGLAQGFLAHAAASVRNFLPENKKLLVTRVTHSIAEMKPNSEDDTFLYLDPKIKAQHGTNVPRQRSPFSQVIVFVIGGGCYYEYQNLMMHMNPTRCGCTNTGSNSDEQVGNLNGSLNNQVSRAVWYGCTELLSPESFLTQISSIKS